MADVPTARGDVVDSSQLGFTLPAEAIFAISTEVNLNWPDISFGQGDQIDLRIEDAVAKLTIAKQSGVDTIVDRCIPGIGRDVALLRRVAESAPVNIVLSTGYYTWQDLPFFFMYREQSGVRYEAEPTLEELFVRDLEEGIAGTGVRAGAIKIVSDHYGLTSGVEHVMRSAAKAHRRTGAPITSHTGVGIGTKSGMIQQDVLLDEGVDLSRVIIGHMDFTPSDVALDEFLVLLEKGSYIGFDAIGLGSPYSNLDKTLERVTELCLRGYAPQLLLSHDDTCFVDIHPATSEVAQRRASGFSPYTQIPLDVLPRLRDRGVTDEQITQITVDNPRRIFETRALGGY